MLIIVIACTHTHKHIQAQTPAIFIILKRYSVLSRLKRNPRDDVCALGWSAYGELAVTRLISGGCPLLVRTEPADRPSSRKGKCYSKCHGLFLLQQQKKLEWSFLVACEHWPLLSANLACHSCLPFSPAIVPALAPCHYLLLLSPAIFMPFPK